MRALLQTQYIRSLGWLIVVLYAVFTIACGLFMVVLEWPIALLPLLCIPILAVAPYFARPVYFSMWVTWVLSSLGISYGLQTHSDLSVAGIILGGVAVLLVLELVHALAFVRQNAEETLEQRDRELSALTDVTATITATLELDHVLQRLVDTVIALFPQVTSATFQILEEEHGDLRTVASSDGAFRNGGSQPVIFRRGEGIAGQSMARRRTINISDVEASPDFLPGDGPPPYRSLLVTPLTVGERVWGTLSLAGAASGAFDDRDALLVESLARQAAIAIENAHLYQETARRAHEQAAVANVARALNASVEVEQAFPAVAAELAALTDCDRASLILLDARNKQFTIAALDTSVPGLHQGRIFPYSAIASLPDLLEGRVHLTPDLKADSGYPVRQILHQAGFRSSVSLPLIAAEEVIGALNLGSKRRAAFTQKHLPWLQQIADALAAAIVKSHLFDRQRSAEARYRGLFEHIADPIAVLAPDGILIDVNPAACLLVGRTRAALIGQNIAVINDVPQATFHQAISKALSGEIVTYGFNTVVNDRQRYFEARLECIDQSERTTLQWVAHDITDRRELDHWREELTGITVHNLRNPLTWVQTGAEAALMLLPEDVDPDVSFALNKALKGAARLEQQIDLLLNINRAEAGQELTDTDLIAPIGLLTEVLDLLKPRAAAQMVRLQSVLPDELPPIVGNRNMLSWTLENLIDNAIKFSPENEIVTIRASVHTRRDAIGQVDAGGAQTSAAPPIEGAPTAQNNPTLRISVMDRGPGIPPADQEQIFRKFYQVRRPQGSKGAGMGLYFCRLAAEAHGGRIWVDNNQDGPGCTFSLALPV
jgi:NtrC-family two-component system sensor histidine kinase KinB